MTKISLMTVSAVLLGGCAGYYAKNSESRRISIANPAAIYCVQQDGKLETQTGNNQRTTYCIFEDGQRIEPWEYYNNQSK
jgi:hypothetical protein